jgi:hypothetical protein
MKILKRNALLSNLKFKTFRSKSQYSVHNDTSIKYVLISVIIIITIIIIVVVVVAVGKSVHHHTIQIN